MKANKETLIGTIGTQIGSIGPGTMFGEGSMILDEPSEATFRVKTADAECVSELR